MTGWNIITEPTQAYIVDAHGTVSPASGTRIKYRRIGSRKWLSLTVVGELPPGVPEVAIVEAYEHERTRLHPDAEEGRAT